MLPPSPLVFKRRSRWLWVSLLALCAFAPLAILQSGRDNPIPMGPYLDGVFPAMTPGQGSGAWQIVDAFPNLSFVAPVHLAPEPGSNRLFVAQHTGEIVAFQNDSTTSNLTTILDLSPVIYRNLESGLLYFVFHPDYTTGSRYIYVFYQFDSGNNVYSRLSRFTISPTTQIADPASELVLIHQYDRSRNHNAGAMFFDDDGFLYLSLGDEGGSNNQFNQGQVLDGRLFGGVIRIDPEMDPTRSHPIRRQPQQLIPSDNSFTANYFIPNDNPWQDTSGGVMEEFIALGLRNPHRMAQDPLTDAIWLGDVGQSAREEVNIIEMGKNYQWPFREGNAIGPQSAPNPIIGTEATPFYDYPHTQGNNCIIGGFVYRGSLHSDLDGQYLMGDNGSKRIWSLEVMPDSSLQRHDLLTAPFGSSYYSISSFAQDDNGEIYVLKLHGSSNQGRVFKLTRQNPGAPEPPQLLSQTGAFSNLQTMEAVDGLLPYKMLHPFWSDGAHKYRWMAVPNDGTHNSADELIEYATLDEWDWPNGSVWVKHFELETNDTNPTQKKKIETRFIIKGDDGQIYGISYRWRDDQTDAELLTDGRVDTLGISTSQGIREVEWYFPSRGECLSCHNEAAGGVLGPKTAQLNCPQYYPLTGRTANQLKTLVHLGMLDSPPDTSQLGLLPQMAALDDPNASLEIKARTYLDANCASCHQPGTGVQANFDARFGTPIDQTGMVYGLPIDPLGQHDSRIIVPGDLEHSILYKRTAAVHNSIAMPPMSKNLLDSVGIELLSEWITQLHPAVSSLPSGQLGQHITFDALAPVRDTLSGITLQASSTSGLPVSFQVVSGPAAISGNQLTLNGATGLVVIRATQAGNAQYHSAPEIERTLVVAPDSAATGSGLWGTYHNVMNLNDSVFSRLDSEIDFYWGSTSPDPQIIPRTFSVNWEGEIEAPTTGAYILSTTTDDGVRVWVDGNMVINELNNQSATEHTATVNLTAWERVPIRIRYYQRGVYASAKLSWRGPQVSPQVVPSYALYPTGMPLDTMPQDTTPLDTVPQDTTPVDTTIGDTMPDDSLPLSIGITPQAQKVLRIWPNSLSSEAAWPWIEVNLPTPTDVRLTLVGLKGQNLWQAHWRGKSTYQEQVRWQQLPPGIYLLVAESAYGRHVQRVLLR